MYSDYFDTNVKYWDDGNTHVLCAESALFRLGLSTQASSHLQFWTTYVELHDVQMPDYSLYYRYNLDKCTEVTQYKQYPWILLPSKERAIIDMISQRQFFNEGTLIEGLQEYMRMCDSTDRLYEVANKLKIGIPFFDVSKKQLDYWIKEAREDDYTCW